MRNEDEVRIDVDVNANQKFVLCIGGLEFRGEEIEKLNKLRGADKTALDFAKNMLMEMVIHKAG
jgi:hypothetical protein